MSRNGLFKYLSLLAALSMMALTLGACSDATSKSGGGKSSLQTPEEVISAATYVGSTKCLSCHGDKENWGKTLHKAVLRAPGTFSPHQAKAETLYASTINAGLTALVGGQVVFFDFDSGTSTWSASTSSGPNTKYSTSIALSGGVYTFTITDVAGSSGSKNYNVLLTYGGERNYKQRYVLEIGASKYMSPIQYNDKGVPGVDQWVPYHPERWYDTTASTLKEPSLANGGFKDAFDGNCAGCHFTGLTVQNINGEEVADAVDDPNGAVDFDGDGTMDEINIGCERCHGPGSAHVSTLNPAYITNPDDLTPAMADMVCGQCHNRGKSFDTFDVFAEGTAKAPYPAIQDMFGEIKTYMVGFGDLSIYYGFDSGSGTFDAQYWGGEPSGGSFITSYQHHQQYIDILQGPHSPSSTDPDIPRCFSCHEMHDNRSPGGHQIATSILEDGVLIKTDNDNDSLCLACHAGLDPFTGLTEDDIQDYANGITAAVTEVSEWVTGHTQHDFDPAGSPGESRCSKCHNPKTAKSARWDPTNADFGDSGTGGVTIRKGDIHSHTFNIIEPKYSKTDGIGRGAPPKSGTESINNACTSCHYPADGKIAAIDALVGDAYLDGLQSEHEPELTAANTGGTPPVLDGDGTDAIWASATPLSFLVGEGMATLDCVQCHSHTGAATTVTLKALFDTTNIYILAQYNDTTASFTRGAWIYDNATTTWSTVSGQSEDRIAFYFPLGSPTGDPFGGNCMKKCHVTDTSGVNGLEDEVWLDTGTADMWHSKAARGMARIASSQTGITVDPVTHEVTGGDIFMDGYFDDKWVGQFDATNDVDGGRFGDAGSNTYARNRNSAKDAPLWIETAPTDFIDAMILTEDEIPGEVITADPGDPAFVKASVDAAWAIYNGFGAVIPERILRDPVGSRGDIRSAATWSDGTWTVEIMRPLDTGNTDDIAFVPGSANKYDFGVAIMDNGGGDIHKPSRKIHLVIP